MLHRSRPARPRPGAVAATAELFGWLLLIATGAGATFGTFVLPLVGTVVGAFFGFVLGIGPAGVLAVLVGVGSRRSDADGTLGLWRVAALLGLLLAGGVALGLAATSGMGPVHGALATGATGAVTGTSLWAVDARVRRWVGR